MDQAANRRIMQLEKQLATLTTTVKQLRTKRPSQTRSRLHGAVAKTTSAITAATGSTPRTAGTGTVTVYKRNKTTSAMEAVTWAVNLVIYNSTTQAAVSGAWIQLKADPFGDCWWDVGDC